LTNRAPDFDDHRARLAAEAKGQFAPRHDLPDLLGFPKARRSLQRMVKHVVISNHQKFW
jgi:hypothetical protein